jgi:hypothetical protein
VSVDRYTTEVTLDVEVEILSATRGTAGRYGDRPERCYPAEGDAVELCVRLGTLDLTAALPPDVLEALAEDALERLQDAADVALLP